MKPILALCAVISLSACATPSAVTVHQIAEKGDTAASDLYVAIASSINAYEMIAISNVAPGEALKWKAWNALTAERDAYAKFGTVDLAALTSISNDVHTLIGH